MRTALLVVDNPGRDLLGIAGIAYWLLRNHGIRPVLTGTRNEIVGLIRHRPDVILLPHVRFLRQRVFLDYARAQGTAIAVLPVEGLPGTLRIIPKAVLGMEELRPFVDLFMSWGRDTAQYVQENRFAPNAEIHFVGCPRFDFHTPAYDSAFSNRQQFLAGLGLPVDAPVITWFSNTAFANMKTPMDEFAKSLLNPNRSAYLVGNDLDLLALRRDDEIMYRLLNDYFRRLIQQYPHCNFIVKPHPQEPPEPYQALRSLSPKVRVIQREYEVSEVIRHSDIQLNWRCSTSLEGWIYNLHKRTISVQGPELETAPYLSDMVKGNDCITGYDNLSRLVNHYLQGGAIDSQVLVRRQEYLDRHLTYYDGRAAERCAGVLADFIGRRPLVRRCWANWKHIVKHYLPHMLRHQRWLIEKRAEGHSKYFPKDRFYKHVANYNSIFNTSISPDRYILEA